MKLFPLLGALAPTVTRCLALAMPMALALPLALLPAAQVQAQRSGCLLGIHHRLGLRGVVVIHVGFLQQRSCQAHMRHSK